MLIVGGVLIPWHARLQQFSRPNFGVLSQFYLLISSRVLLRISDTCLFPYTYVSPPLITVVFYFASPRSTRPYLIFLVREVLKESLPLAAHVVILHAYPPLPRRGPISPWLPLTAYLDLTHLDIPKVLLMSIIKYVTTTQSKG